MMGDARNVYPRLCWGCLAIIEDYAHDCVNLNYGGFCFRCQAGHMGDMPYLRQVVQGYAERMNSVVERDELLQEVKMLSR
jgi:hypothetical protein